MTGVQTWALFSAFSLVSAEALVDGVQHFETDPSSFQHLIAAAPASANFQNHLIPTFRNSAQQSHLEQFSTNQAKLLEPSHGFPQLINQIVHKNKHAKYSQLQSSVSSFSEHVKSSNGQTKHSKTSSATQAKSTSNADGQSKHETYEVVHAEQSETADGHMEQSESTTAAQTVKTTKADGTAETKSETAAQSVTTSTANGKTDHSEIKAAAAAVTTNVDGEEHSQMVSALQTQKAQTSDGETEITQAVAVTHAEQKTHADGQTEGTADLVAIVRSPSKDNNIQSEDAKTIENIETVVTETQTSKTVRKETTKNDTSGSEELTESEETAEDDEVTENDDTNENEDITENEETAEDEEAIQNEESLDDEESSNSEEYKQTDRANENATAESVRITGDDKSDETEADESVRTTKENYQQSTQYDVEADKYTYREDTDQPENTYAPSPPKSETIETDIYSTHELKKGRYDLNQMDGAKAIHKAIEMDMNYKMLLMEDGKCFCTCTMNSRPTFIEMDEEPLL